MTSEEKFSHNFTLEVQIVRKILTLQFLGPNLDLLCVRQSDDEHFCENFAKLYFDAKYLEKGSFNEGGEIFDALLFKKVVFLANFGPRSNFL